LEREINEQPQIGGDRMFDRRDQALLHAEFQQRCADAAKVQLEQEAEQAEADAAREAQEKAEFLASPVGQYLEQAGMSPMNYAKAKRVLLAPVTTKAYGFQRSWEHINTCVSAGYRPVVEQVDKIKPMSAKAYFRAGNREQEAHEAKTKAAGKKSVYWLTLGDSSYSLNKTEYDFATYLVKATA
jgi:hypothetical protein